MTETELTAAVASLRPDGPVAARGVHLHVGSQLGAVDAWRDAVRRGARGPGAAAGRAAGLRHARRRRRVPRGRPRHRADARPVRRGAAGPARGDPGRPAAARLAVEPGRFLVARAGWIVATVLHVRERGDAERVVVLDAGMTELIRPMLYGAEHPVVALTSLGVPVVGGRGHRPPSVSMAPSARAPTPSAGTTCRRCAAATSWRSARPARTPPRWRPPTTGGPRRPRSCSRRTGRSRSAGGAGARRSAGHVR